MREQRHVEISRDLQPGSSAGGIESDDWMQIAKEAYQGSTDYLDTNIRKKVDDALRMFQNRHASDSKYNTDAYRYRSKFFRPKTRTMVRRHEGALAAALFSNDDWIDVRSEDEGDERLVAGAKVAKALLQFRLKKSIPWFQVAIGAYQDALKSGMCISYNYWCYKTRPGVQTTTITKHDEMGNVLDTQTQEEPTQEVVEDRPAIELMPIENLRFSPNAKWDDVVGTSPYIIRIVPMYVDEVLDRMETPDRAGVTWEKMTASEIAASKKNLYDTTRSARAVGRQDPQQDGSERVQKYEIVYALEFFVRKQGEIFVYWTMGTDRRLTEPRKLEEVYLHKQIPITIGYAVLETHKVYPDSMVTISAPTQQIINDVANQRLDNVRLVLNKQWLIRSGGQIDTSNLVNNVPGGATIVANVESDVKAIEWGDVTHSSFEEHDRFNAEYDDLTGQFAAGSVNTNRNLNETVGGLSLLASGANANTEYTLRTFVQTWVLPTLRQLLALEQKYETDEVVLKLAAKYAQVWQEFSSAEDIANMLNADFNIKMAVGLQVTDSGTKIARFVLAQKTVSEMAAAAPGIPGFKLQENIKEVYNLLGYGDGERFFSEEDFKQQTMQQAQQQAQGILTQASELAQAVVAQSQQVIDKARTAEDSAEAQQRAVMEEQQQLLKMQMALLQREMALALKELASENAEQSAGGKAEVVGQLNEIILTLDQRAQEVFEALDAMKQQDTTGVGEVVLSESQAIMTGLQNTIRQAQASIVSGMAPRGPRSVPTKSNSGKAPAPRAG